MLADYRSHHPNILPKAYFAKVEVTKGGEGAGTEFIADMKILRQQADVSHDRERA